MRSTRILYLLTFIIWQCSASAQTPATPTNLISQGYECHVLLRWSAVTNAAQYRIYRAESGGAFAPIVTLNRTSTVDWTGLDNIGKTYSYQVTALAANGSESTPTPAQTITTATMDDIAMMDMIQEASFRYFWDFAHPVSGMARERSNGDNNIVTTGGTGFGIMSIVVAAERGWITRAEALNRLIQIGSFLQFADTFHGAFPHWMNGNTGNVVPFSTYDNGGDLVETAFLMQGLLTARQYFDGTDALETAFRDVVDGLWEAVEWDWYRRSNSNVLYWHWSPNYNWQMNFQLRGFNETHIVYLLAVASPTHPVPASLYTQGWAGNSNYTNPSIQFGHKVYTGPFGGGPMFFAHYSYLGFDPRGIKDAYCNYFIRNQNHARIQVAYSMANPENHQGYSADCWGLTASDNPFGYMAHDIYPTNDNGTITPTAALSSMPYVPEEALRAMRHFYRVQGQKLWGVYGFYDAFNLDQNWFSNAYLAIDQGPIAPMIENFRTGLLWKKFMSYSPIDSAVAAVGFVSDGTSGMQDLVLNKLANIQVSPMPVPAHGRVNVRVELPRPGRYQWCFVGQNGQLTPLTTYIRYETTRLDRQLELPNTLIQGVLTLIDEQGRVVASAKVLK